MLDSDTAGVEEDEEDDRPVERLLLHHTPDHISEKGHVVKSNPLLGPNNPKLFRKFKHFQALQKFS